MKRRLLLLLLVAVAAGCGGGDDGDGDGTEGSAGAQVYAEAGCGSCHVFSPAGSDGTVGPNLDEAEVSFEQAVQQVTNGGGGMPAFEGDLTEQEIEDVARYITEEGGSSTGGTGGSVIGPFALTGHG